MVDRAVADPHHARGDVLEPRHHAQRRRLAAARRPDEDHELTVADIQAQGADGLGPVGVDLRDLVEYDLCHAPSPVALE